MMYDVILDHLGNQKRITIKLPIIPRIKDWLMLHDCKDFTQGKVLTVEVVIISNSSDPIILLVSDKYEQ